MLKSDDGWLFSSQDLTTFMTCQHAAALNRQVQMDASLSEWRRATTAASKAAEESDGLGGEDPVIARGNAHESNVLISYKANGLSVKEIDRPERIDESSMRAGYDETLDAMRHGYDVIYQGVLLDGAWFGYSDFLVKRPGRSAFGDYLYEVHDTKLARSLKVSALIQLAHYGLILETMQQAAPTRLVVVLGDGTEAPWLFDDAAPYVVQLREAVREFHDTQPSTQPEPISACQSCNWKPLCDEEWGPHDLSLVHRLNRRQRRLLGDIGVTTIPELAQAPDAVRPARIGAETFARLRAQAVAQCGEKAFEVVRPQAATGVLGDVPVSHHLDVYFDLEGDPFAAAPTLDYLWAFCDRDGNYFYREAHDLNAERQAFTWFLDQLREREAKGGQWHVYHYNAYETASLRRIADKWPDAEQREGLIAEVEHFIETRFDDLYRRVEGGVRPRDGSTSLKVVEKLAGYDRAAEPALIAAGDDSIKAYELAIAAGLDSDTGRDLITGIRQYNEHDVKATAAVHSWLFDLGDELTDEDLVHVDVEEYVPSDKLQQRINETEALERQLTDACAEKDRDDAVLPSGLTTNGGRLLASMLAWHRREEVVQWTDFYRLCNWARTGEVEIDVDLSTESVETGIREGTEHESVLQDLAVVEIAAPERGKRKSTYTITCAPGAWKVRVGDALQGVTIDESEPRGRFEVIDHDAQEGTAVVASTIDVSEFHALVIQPFSGSDAPWRALMRLAEAALAATPSGGSLVALRVLDRHAPTALAPLDQADAQQRARDAAAALTPGELLPIQGPPGTGKTRVAAQIILDEVRRRVDGRCRIGVTANSHKVIDNLLAEVMQQALEQGFVLSVLHVDGAEDEGRHADVRTVKSGTLIASEVDSAGDSPVVVGATKYGWSRQELVDSLDLLVIDEAGQVPLADALGMVQAASGVVAVGDPQQLAAPIQAAHEAAAKVSLLEHLIASDSVIAPKSGVFLNVSHRMHYALCEVVGRLAYESSLHASDAANQRGVEGPLISVGGCEVMIGPGVRHLPVDGGEEAQIAAAVGLVGQLTDGRITVLASKGIAPAPLTAEDVLVVAPHNATVNRLRRDLHGVEVGTVDKFQGRQAHVVVYVMGREATESRDVPFLYELNRVNVALSRARLMAVVVTGPGALHPPVSEPQHLRLASRFALAMGEPG